MSEDKNLILMPSEQKEFFDRVKDNPDKVDEVFEELYERQEKELKKQKGDLK